MLPSPSERARLALEIAAALKRGALVLASTARAARALRRAHTEAQRAEGLSAWATPKIEDWAGWLDRLWQQHALTAETPLVLTPFQEHALWRRVQNLEAQVVAPERLAELAQDGYRVLSDYRAHTQRSGYGIAGWGGHEDSERFLGWAESFDQLCAREDWLPACRMAEVLADTIAEGSVTAPAEIVLVGFDRTTPAQQHLLDACQARGATIIPAPAAAAVEPRLIRAAHQRQELEACAWWARTHVERDPTARLAILAPDLGPVRGELDRTLRRVLTPEGQGPQAAPLWEFSLGIPLGNVPLVKAAMLLLSWLGRPLDPDESAWLVTSGFLAPSVADAAALLRLRLEDEALVPSLALSAMRRQAQLPPAVRAALDVFESFARANQFSSAQRTCATWADLAQAALRLTAWPGHREADSAAFQARQRWEQLLDQVALLAFDQARVSWAGFLDLLATHARGTLFTLESEDAPIQILGAFEASGLQFDALWFLGVDDQRWPASGRPHPLLPLWLQRASAMPHATSDADWQLAQEVTRRIAASAPEVVLSHAARDKDVELRPSPLLAALFPLAAATPVAFPKHAALLVHRAASLEEITDHSGLIPWPPEEVAGGADVLRRQAACAFQSFAARRLQLGEGPEASLGLDQGERGSLLHHVLERVWSAEPGDPTRLHTLDDLRTALNEGSMPDMLAHHIDAEFAREFGPSAANEESWAGAYLSLEKQRLQTLLSAWLECEAERVPFTISGIERSLPNVAVGGLRLSLRVDRIDELADGTRLLVDYKSSAVSAAVWDGERPDEPQLPLYLAHGGIAGVSGIAFAQLRPQDTKLIARAERPELLGNGRAGKSALDGATREAWAEALGVLARAFLRGEAVLNPKHGAATCRYCRMQSLCRIAEAPLLDDDTDAEEEIMPA